MKRVLSVLLALALILACAPAIPLTANAATSGYYTYTVSNGKATITNCNSSISGDITIPATLGGYPVTSIDSCAFSNCSSLTSVTIPDSVTSIGYEAFQYCSSLTGIWVGADNTAYCSDEQGVLYNKDKTTLIQAPAKGITGTYTIPDSVTSIGVSAFNTCSSLTSVVIPDNVTGIGSYAFYGCSSLTSVVIGDSVTSIGDSAFNTCSSLTSMVIPDSVTNIGYYAFCNCSSLTSVVIGDSVTGIVYSAFSWCSSLTSVVIGDSVTSIGLSAFEYCNSLTSVAIPDSVISIGFSAFYDCSSLSHVAYTGTQSQWNSISIGSNNSALTGATRHYETSFEIVDNCVEAGVYCPVCKEFIVRTERGNHQETPVPGCAPSCTEPGLTDGIVCTMCGEVVTQQVEIPATGHDTIDGVCRNCDYGKNVVILEGDGETFYSTVENALAAATGGTIKLLTDMQAGTLVLPSGVNLDLNGYTLTARYLIVMQDAAILDGAGNLKIAKKNLVYAQENGNGIIPVWNGTDGYLFTRVTFQQMANPLGNGAAQYLFLPSFSNGAVTALMADGGLDNGLKFKVNLVWNNGQIQQLYTYEEAFVKQVFDGTYQWVFTLNVTGIGSIEDMVARPVVVTDCIVQATANGTALVAG